MLTLYIQSLSSISEDECRLSCQSPRPSAIPDSCPLITVDSCPLATVDSCPSVTTDEELSEVNAKIKELVHRRKALLSKSPLSEPIKYTCEFCGLDTPNSETQLAQHVNRCQREREQIKSIKFMCELCGLDTPNSKTQLDQHVKRCQREQRHQFDSSLAKNEQPDNEQPVREHVVSTLFTCGFCGLDTPNSETQLAQHVNRCQRERERERERDHEQIKSTKFTCELCGLDTPNSKTQLDQHVKRCQRERERE